MHKAEEVVLQHSLWKASFQVGFATKGFDATGALITLAEEKNYLNNLPNLVCHLNPKQKMREEVLLDILAFQKE